MHNMSFHAGSVFILRSFSSLIFISAGINHLLHPVGVVSRLIESELGTLALWMAPASVLVFLSGIGLIIGGFFYLIGWKTHLSAGLLILLLIPITLTVQVSGDGVSGPFFKNIALLGTLIFFMINRNLPISVDHTLSERNKTKHLTHSKKL